MKKNSWIIGGVLLMMMLFGGCRVGREKGAPMTPQINISSTSVKLYPNDSVSLSATTTPVGQAVTWTSSSSLIVVDDTGVVTATEGAVVGTVATITATMVYKDIIHTSQCQVTIEEPFVQLDDSKVMMYINQSKNLSYLTGPTSQTIHWSSSDSTIADVSSSGNVFGMALGSATITATMTYYGETYTDSCYVIVLDSSITLNATSLSLMSGDQSTLVAATIPSDLPVSWSSSDPSVVTVSSSGVVTGVASGNATITATMDNQGVSLSATCAVDVTTVLTTLNRETATIFVNQTTQISGTINVENSSLTWSSSDSTIATVDNQGMVTGHAVGSAVISGVGEYNGVEYSDTCVVTVIDQGVVLDKNEETLYLGENSTLTATTIPSGQAVSWSSSDSSIASVSSAGVITGVGVGVASVQATINDNGTSYTASCTVTIQQPFISFSQSSMTIYTGESSSIEFTSGPTSQALTWSSSNESLISVSESGVVTAHGTGVGTITATMTYLGVTYSDSLQVTSMTPSLDLNLSALTLSAGKLYTLVGTTLPSGQVISWSSSDPSVASVSSSGVVTGIVSGETEVTASFTYGGLTYSSQATITVQEPAVVLSQTEGTLLTGHYLTLTATTTPLYQSVTWNSSDRSVATVSSSGEVTGISAGSAMITVTMVYDSISYTQSCQITVKLLGVSLNPQNAQLYLGDTLSFDVSVEPEGSLVTYSSSDSSVATISSSGEVSALSAGSATMTATISSSGVTYSDSAQITVIAPSISLSSNSVTLYVNDQESLVAETLPANQAVIFSSSDASIASIDSSGNISTNQVGTATMTAKMSYNGVEYSASCAVSILTPSITLSQNSATLFVSDQLFLQAVLVPSDHNFSLEWSSSDSSVATVSSSGEITAVSAGIATITAILNHEGVLYTDSLSLTVESANITLSESSATLLVGNTLTLQAITSLSLPITWSSSSSGVATVDSSGVVTAVSAGSVLITASYDYNGVLYSDSELLTVMGEGVVLNTASETLYPTQTFQLSATTNPSGQSVSWSSSDSTIASVSSSGVVSAKIPGNAIITATMVSNGVTYQASATILNVAPSVVIENSQINVYQDDHETLNATVFPSSSTVEWSSSDASIVSVDNQGVIVALQPGVAIITAKILVSGIEFSDSVTVTVLATSLNLEDSSLSLYTNDLYNLVVVTVPSDLTLNYSSANELVATVNSQGIVQAISPGSTSITVMMNHEGVLYTQSCQVTVSDISIALDQSSAELIVSGSLSLSATTRPTLQNVTWSSSNGTVASVSSSGVVSAHQVGTSIVTGEITYNGVEYSATCLVKVSNLGISLNNNSATLHTQDTITLIVTTSPTSLVSWSSSDSSVATVDASGVVTATGVGVATITAAMENDGTIYESSCLVSVVLPSIVIDPTSTTIYINENKTLSAVTDVLGEVVTWSSSDPSVVTVSSSGVVTGISEGSAMITASITHGGTYSFESVVDVATPMVTLNHANESLYVSEKLIISATTLPLNQGVTWSSSNESVATVSGGVVTAHTAGEATITATMTYQGKDYTQNCFVEVLPIFIQLEKTQLTLYTGDVGTINATISPNDQDIYWISSNNEILSVSATGIYTALQAGSATLTAGIVYNSVLYQSSATLTILTPEISTGVSSISGYVGDSLTLAVTTIPTTVNLTWSSSDPLVVTVSSEGEITLVGEGNAEVIAKFTYNGVEYHQSFTIVVTSTAIVMSQSSVELYSSDTYQLTATTTPANLEVTWSSNHENVATVDSQGNVVTHGNGVAMITASCLYQGVSYTAQTELKVYATGVSLSYGSKTMYLNEGESLVATTTPSGQEVSWSSSDSAVVSVDQLGNLTALTLGSATITASMEYRGATYLATCLVSVEAISATLSNSSIELFIGENQPLSLVVTPSSATVVWSSSDESIATVSSSGTVTAVSAGSVTITGVATYAGESVSVTVTIMVKNYGVILPTQTVTLYASESSSIEAVTFPSGQLITWSSSDSAIASVSSSGVITAVAPGSVTITASMEYLGTTYSESLSVTVLEVSLMLSQSTLSLHTTESATVSATTLPLNQEVSWSSSDASVATVSSNGNIVANASGSAIITASMSYNQVSYQQGVAVTVSSSGISLNQTALTLYHGESSTLVATTSPLSGTISWSSSNTNVATVTSSGQVEADESGVATITALWSYNGYLYSASCEITVETIIVDYPVHTASLFVGESLTPTLSIAPQTLAVNYESSDSLVVSVSAIGELTALSAGSATITASSQYGGHTYSDTMIVDVLSTGVIINSATQALYTTDTLTLSATTSPSGESVTWSSSNSSVATVTNSGVVTPISVGECIIIASINYLGTNYYAYHTIYVIEPSISIASSDVYLYQGDDSTLATTSLYEGDSQTIIITVVPESSTLTYQSSNSAVVSVSSDGKMKAISAGEAVITVTANYNGWQGSAMMAVTVFETKVTLNESSKTLYQGDRETLVAQTVPSNQLVVWHSSDESIASVSSSGEVMAVQSGEAIITAEMLYQGEKYSATSLITVLPVTLSIDQESAFIIKNATLQLSATTTLENPTITWSSSNQGVATVSSSGVVTAQATGISSGEATVTASMIYNSVTYSDSCQVSVAAVGISLSQNIATLYLNESMTLTANTGIPGAAVTWSSSDPTIASVDSQGNITTHQVGSVIITATTVDQGVTYTSSCDLLVNVPSVTLVGQIPLYIGDIVAMTVTTGPGDQAVSYSSSSDMIATISSEGSLEALSAGESTITASMSYFGTTYSDALTVEVKKPEVSVNQLMVSLYVGNSTTLVASSIPSGETISWSSSDSTVATISSQGEVVGISQGSAEMTASFIYEGNSYETTVLVSVHAVSLVLDTTSISLAEGSSGAITAVTTPSDQSVTYSSSDSLIATVDEAGVIKAVSAGGATITAMMTYQGTSYSASCSVTVISSGIFLPISSATVYITDTAVLSATTIPANQSITWTTSDSSVTSIDASSLVITAVGVGESIVTASMVYNATTYTASAVATVLDPAPIISPSSLSLYTTDTQALSLQAPPTVNAIWSSSNESVATVSSSGVVSANASGSATIGVSYVYNGQTYQASIPISVSTTSVSWNETEVTLYLNESKTISAIPVPAQESVLYASQNETIATITDSGVISGTSVGTTAVVAVMTYNGAYYIATIPVTVIMPTITYEQESLSLYRGESATVATTLSPSTGVVSFSSSDEAVASIASSGEITGNSSGSAMITATLTYQGVTVSDTLSVTVSQPTIDISMSKLSLYLGDQALLTATTTPSGQAVSWSSSDSSVATVTSGGTIATQGAGEVTITSTMTYQGIVYSDTCKVVVTTPTIEIKATSASLYIGEFETLTINSDPLQQTITWSSSSSSVATISSSGVLTGVSVGTTVIQASYLYQGVTYSDSYTISVITPVVDISSLASTLYVGDTKQIIASTQPSGLTVMYSSSNTSVAVVSSTGIVTAYEAGSTNITASISYNGVIYSDVVSMTVKTVSISLNYTTKSIYQEDYLQLLAITTPSGQNVTWSSDDTYVASVSSSGLVTGKTEGIAMVTAMMSYNGISYSATCVLSVTQPYLLVTPSTLSLYPTESYSLVATATPIGEMVSWSSGNSTYATISSGGVVTAQKVGSVVVTGTMIYGTTSYSDTATVTILTPVISITGSKTTLYSGDTMSLIITTGPSGQSSTLSSSNSSVATISSTGVVTAVSAGNVTMTATMIFQNVSYSAQYSVTVISPSVSLSSSSTALYIGDSNALVATTVPSGQGVTWSSSNSSVASVSSSGVVTAISAGSATITASITYNGTLYSTTNSVTVTKPSVSLSSTLLYYIGDSKTLTATTVPSGQTITWSSSDSSVATINSSSGALVALKAGSSTITASFIYQGVTYSATSALTISTPTISLNYSTLDKYVAGTTTLTATLLPSSGGTLSWSSSSTAVATVDSSGKVTAVGAGTATITATYTYASIEYQASCSITVTLPTISLSATSISLYNGDQYTLTATRIPSTQTVTWSSSGTSIATVSSSGKVTAVSAGTVNITASITVEGVIYSAVCVVKVTKPSVNVSTTDIGDWQLQFTANPDPSGQTITWSSSDETVGTITQTGLFQGLKVGTTTVKGKFTYNGTTYSSNTTVNVILN